MVWCKCSGWAGLCIAIVLVSLFVSVSCACACACVCLCLCLCLCMCLCPYLCHTVSVTLRSYSPLSVQFIGPCCLAQKDDKKVDRWTKITFVRVLGYVLTCMLLVLLFEFSTALDADGCPRVDLHVLLLTHV